MVGQGDLKILEADKVALDKVTVMVAPLDDSF